MRRIGLAVVLAVMFLGPLAGEAQPPVKVPVLGILYPSSPSPEGWQRSPLLAQLRELGWVKGKTIAFERRHAKGDYARLPALAAELVRLPVDVIITYSTPAAFAAKQATSTIPIVIASGVEDPVALGLVSSLARPGGNVTGSVTGGLGVGMFGKRVQLLKEVVPHLTRLDELYNPENPSQARDSAAYAPVLQMGVQVQRFAVRDAATLEHALAEIAKRKPDALLIAADPATTVAHSKSIVDFAVRHRLPADLLLPAREEPRGRQHVSAHRQGIPTRPELSLLGE